MKNIIAGIFILAFIVALSSCKKCATCTYTDEVYPDSTLTNEVCAQGHSYEEALTVHQESGWDCTED